MAGTAPSPVNYSATVSEVTTQQYMRGEWDETKKQRALLEKMDMYGNIEENGSGTYVEWKARVGEWDDGYRTDLDARTFQRKNHRITATLPWSFLEVTGVLSDRDVQLNRGTEAIVNIKDNLITEIGQDFKKKINRRLLRENASSNTSMGIAAYSGGDVPIYGLPTILNPGSTLYQHNTASTALTVSHKRVKPNVMYAGHSTADDGLIGVDNAVSDAWSPYIINSGYNWDGAGGNSWAENCIHVANDMMTGLAHGDTAGEFPDLGVMTKQMFTDFKALLFTKQRIIVGNTPSAPDVGLLPRFHIPFEGATFVYDTDQATDIFYLLNTAHMKLKVVPAGDAGSSEGGLGGSTELFNVTQQHSIEQGGHLVAVTFATQLCVEPRYQGCAYPFVTS